MTKKGCAMDIWLQNYAIYSVKCLQFFNSEANEPLHTFIDPKLHFDENIAEIRNEFLSRSF